MSLIELILSLPVHLAIFEKDFSLINAVKIDWRSKLGEDVLTNQLCIILHSSEIAWFGPLFAICL